MPDRHDPDLGWIPDGWVVHDVPDPTPAPEHAPALDFGGAENVTDDGVAHFLLITADREPDRCGGCGERWPCEYRVGLDVQRVEQVTPSGGIVVARPEDIPR
jgi:hypothetical protein